MNFTQKQKEWDDVNKKYIFHPRIYTDFYCSLPEWTNLGRGKDNFIRQIRNKIAYDDNGLWEQTDKETYVDGTRKLSLNRTGIRDSIQPAIYSATIIKQALKLVTHKDINVLFDCHKGAIKFVILSFPNCEMPNIVVIISEYSMSSTNYTIQKCIDCVYKTLQDKLTDYYNGYLKKFYNSNHDRYFYVSREDDWYDLTMHKGLWKWEDVFHLKEDREQNNIKIDYNTDEKLITV